MYCGKKQSKDLGLHQESWERMRKHDDGARMCKNQ